MHFVPGMIIPLTCTVDYHGFRVLAVAKVPVSTPVFTSSGKLRRLREDMVHGTLDGGRTILNENRLLNSNLQEIAEKLNLSLHLVKVKTCDMVMLCVAAWFMLCRPTRVLSSRAEWISAGVMIRLRSTETKLSFGIGFRVYPV